MRLVGNVGIRARLLDPRGPLWLRFAPVVVRVGLFAVATLVLDPRRGGALDDGGLWRVVEEAWAA